MRYVLFIAPLLILLICGLACTRTEAPSPIITPAGTEINAQAVATANAQLDAVLKAKLAVAQYELKLYEEELKAAKDEIRQAATAKGPSPSLLNWENELKGKVIQTKVKIREIEILPR
jgi:hypothetical protein